MVTRRGLTLGFIALVLGAFHGNSLAFAESSEVPTPACDVTIQPEKELLITDLSVVNDSRALQPDGPWSFGYMMKQLTPEGVNPSDFTLQWLNEWKSVTSLNGYRVPTRGRIQRLIRRWPKDGGKLDLDQSPLRLMAIVSRFDQRNFISAGEARFVYGWFSSRTGRPLRFTVIIEFSMPIQSDRVLSTQDWANRWHELAALPFGQTFNQKLELLTRAITTQGAYPGRPSQSAFSQLRTNEINLGLFTWQMREFTLDAQGMLKQTTVKQTPDRIFNRGAFGGRRDELVQWIQENLSLIRENKHVIPNEFLAGASKAPFTWLRSLKRSDSPEIREARDKVAFQTCNGCHTRETGTRFLHLSTRNQNEASVPSAFLQGDLKRRAEDLKAILCVDSRAGARLPDRDSTRVH